MKTKAVIANKDHVGLCGHVIRSGHVYLNIQIDLNAHKVGYTTPHRETHRYCAVCANARTDEQRAEVTDAILHLVVAPDATYGFMARFEKSLDREIWLAAKRRLVAIGGVYVRGSGSGAGFAFSGDPSAALGALVEAG